MSWIKCLLIQTFILFLASCSSYATPNEQPNYGRTATNLPSITATAVPSITATADASSTYIGLKYPPLPSSIKTSTSWQGVIWNPSTPGAWSVSAVMDNTDIMLWLSKTIGYDDAGHAIFQVSDAVLLPPSARDKKIVVSECVFGSQPDYEIVALVNLDQASSDRRWLPNSNIIATWRVDQSQGKLEPISTEKIECNAEDFLGFP
jgi:hypothetical protein